MFIAVLIGFYFLFQFIKSEWTIQVGFFEGIRNLIKNFDLESAKILGLLILWFAALVAASIFSLVSWLKNKKVPAIIAAVLFLLSLNFISLIFCIFGIKPRFLEGKKPLLFIAGYIGVVLALLATSGGANNNDDGTKLFVYILIATLFAVVLNFAGWQKNNALLTLIAGIVYIASLIGIPSAVLCFIGRAQLKKQGA